MKSYKRIMDELAEQKVAEYVDKNIYDKANFDYKRNYNAEFQKRGVDVVFKFDADTYYFVDEKAAITAWDYDLQTFAIELSAPENYNSKSWFSDDDYHITTHYVFIYPRATTASLDEITSCEAILVSKKVLQQYLCSKGIDNTIITKWPTLNYSYDDKGREYVFFNGLKIIKSTQLNECPTNVLITKDTLKSLAEKSWTI